MGLIPCFSSAGFSLRQCFKINRLSVGTMWKWFQWGFIQPSSHHSSESVRVSSASEVFAGGVGGSDKRRESHLRWQDFWEVAHHLHYAATAYCASSNKYSIRATNCHHSRVNGALNVLPQETTKSPFPKMDRAYSVIWKKTPNHIPPNNNTTTTPKKTPNYSYWLLLCSPIAVHRAFTSRRKQGTDVGWLKNLSFPLFYWLVTTEKFALIYFKSKWLGLHKTGGKSQFLMRKLNKDSV